MININEKKQTLGRSPGAVRYPQHRITITPAFGQFSVYLGDQLLANSDQVLCVNEDGYQQVLYFPPSSVHLEKLLLSDSVTTCPFKGMAGYYAAEIDGSVRDVAWYYPNTYDDVSPLKEFIAFYSDRVTIQSEFDHAS